LVDGDTGIRWQFLGMLSLNAPGLLQVRVSKWLKDLEKMFYGGCESYEKVRCAMIAMSASC